MILDEFNLSSYQIDQFKKYYQFLVEENEKINLTTITEETEVYIKHFYDSLKIKDVISIFDDMSLLDIGSGAGFPGIPLKILFPNLKLTIIEPTAKRVNFLKNVIQLLNLQQVELINNRAEDEIVNRRELFDLVTARAVATLPVLLELSIPYLKVKGVFLALKGSSYQEELDLSQSALKKLNCRVLEKYIYELPNNMGMRAIITIQKDQATNKMYPRKYSLIKKNHL